MKIKNRTVTISLQSFGWSIEDSVYQVALDGLCVYRGAPKDGIEVGITALMMDKTHRSLISSASRYTIHTRTMSLHNRPDDASEMMIDDDEIHAIITLRDSDIKIVAKSENGEDWSVVLPRNYFGHISHAQTTDERKEALESIDEASMHQQKAMYHNTYMAGVSGKMQNEICMEHAILCQIITHAHTHDLELPHHAVISYVLDISTGARRALLGIERQGTAITNAPIGDYFRAEYIKWQGLRTQCKIAVQKGFEDYKDLFPKDLMTMGAQIAPLAFLIDKNSAHLRCLEITEDEDLESPSPLWVFSQGVNAITSHQKMRVMAVESKIQSIIAQYEESLRPLQAA